MHKRDSRLRVLREQVEGGWRRLHNEKFHNLYILPNIRVIKLKKMRQAGNLERMAEIRNAYNIFIGEPEGKIPRVRPRRRWEGNIRIELREIVWEDMDWIQLAQGRDQWRESCKHANESSGFIKFGQFLI